MSAARKLSPGALISGFFGRLKRERTECSEVVGGLARIRNRIGGLDSLQATEFLEFCLPRMMNSSSQIFQDLFVLYVLEEKRDGFFCDFGATNGVDVSNSYMLERSYNWTGICAEPARGWHDELRANRPGAHIETECVWKSTGEELEFSEVGTKEFSTIQAFTGSDRHARKRRRRNPTSYTVSTISLNELLKKYDAPCNFDFLSIDTEGSEYPILQAADFSRYQPKVITVEHNYTPNREAIFKRLSSVGYRRVMTEFSDFDDWYVHEAVQSSRV